MIASSHSLLVLEPGLHQLEFQPTKFSLWVAVVVAVQMQAVAAVVVDTPKVRSI
jgi:hypothetical protein